MCRYPSDVVYNALRVSPFIGIEMSMTRRAMGNADAATMPPLDARISLEQALAGYTGQRRCTTRIGRRNRRHKGGLLADFIACHRIRSKPTWRQSTPSRPAPQSWPVSCEVVACKRLTRRRPDDRTTRRRERGPGWRAEQAADSVTGRAAIHDRALWSSCRA